MRYDEELDSGLRELWASHESASDEPAVDDTELDEPDVLDVADESPAPRRAGDEEEEGQGKRRRRRRRGGRRRREEGGEGPAAVSKRERIEEPVDDLDADLDVDVDEEPEEVAPVSSSSRDRRRPDEEEEPRSGKRRRRRRRKPETAVTERDDFDDEADDDAEGPASIDYLSDEKGDSHKRIPTWDDAIGSIVAANMENRGSRSPAPRSGGGRDNRHRR